VARHGPPALPAPPSATSSHDAALRLQDLPADLLSVITMEMVRHSPKTAMALRATSHHFFKEVDATMVGALKRGSALLAQLLTCPRVSDLLRLAREIEDLHLDPLSLMVQNTQKQEAGDEVWRASDYGGVVRRAPDQSLHDVSSPDPFYNRRRAGQ
jgi:hypothetical protein